MIKNFIIVFFLLPFTLLSQTTADFENIILEDNSFLNGSDGVGGFESGNIFLYNDFDTQWQSWLGWCISNVTDNTTPGFLNQYSAIAGGGANNSTNFAVTYAFDPVIIEMTEEGVGVLNGFYICNNTYTYYSMLEGDSFAKRFGGITGDDPDFLLLTVKRWWKGIMVDDSINVYLADYRFDDNTEDYILDDWTYIDLAPFYGNVDSVQLSLTSSDVGQFGMNTPAYLCMDDFTTSDTQITSTDNVDSNKNVYIYPNPSSDFIEVETDLRIGDLKIIDNLGRLILKSSNYSFDNPIDVSSFSSGIFTLIIESKNGTISSKFKVE